MDATDNDRPAPLMRRLLAALVDLGGILAIAGVAFVATGRTPEMLLTPGSLVLVSAVAMFWCMLTEGTALAATPGKLLLGLRVRPLAGGRLDFAVGAIRAWPWWLTGALGGVDPKLIPAGAALCVIALLPVLFSSERRGVHDRMSGTRVVAARGPERPSDD